MFFLLIQLDLVTQISNVAIDTHAHIAGAPHLIKDRFICALMLLYQRRKQHDTRPFRQFEDRVDHLLDRLLADLAPTLWTVRMADTCIEQAQVIIDLRHRSDR